MIISVASGSGGWGKYVTQGTTEKPRDQRKVEIIDGDIELGDLLSKQNKYEDSYYTFVLGFEGKPDKDQIQSMYEDFKKHMFVGLQEDEYHIDSVIHYDTDDTHIHCRVPKQNLLTNTHLQLYYDKIDRPRKELIQDYISLKYGESIAREVNRPIIQEQKDELINQWRSERSQEPFNFAKKADKQLAEAEINKYIIELHQARLINSTQDIKEVLEKSLNLKVERFGTDLKKDFSYVTISDENGKKLRIKGEIYNDKFYENTRADREKQVRDNKRDFGNTEKRKVRFKQVQASLRKANERRYSKTKELFETGRAKADERLSAIIQNIENKVSTNNIEPISNGRNITRDELQNIREPQANTNVRAERETNTNDIEKPKVKGQKDELIRRTTKETIESKQEERAEIRIRSRRNAKELSERIRTNIKLSEAESARDAARIQTTAGANIREQQEIKRNNIEQSEEALGQIGNTTEAAKTRQSGIATVREKSRFYKKFTDKFNEYGRKVEKAREQIVDYIKNKFTDISKSFYNQEHHKKDIAEDFREYNFKAENDTLTRTDVYNSIKQHNTNLEHTHLVEAQEKTRQQSQEMGYSR